MYDVVLSSRGQVVIPAEVRKELNLKEGDVLYAYVEDRSRLVLKAKRKEKTEEDVVTRTAGLFADMEMTGAEYVENIRKESGRRLDELEDRR
ncbi:MAG TPA: AbrB/MazE/SpoVT family DNA-binding domain-containing protein [Spirochaetia bacterium]|nr:AbrB/MazE/SpoVT family DNA-binding domain-containing protein [Spirochaetia bacterium]